MVVIHKNNESGYLCRLQRYGSLRRTGIEHNEILGIVEKKKDDECGTSVISDSKTKLTPAHTKVRKGHRVKIVLGYKKFYVIFDDNNRFVGFYSGCAEEAVLPRGLCFKRW